MEGASGHLSREGSFSSRHGRPGRALSSPDTWVAHHGDNTRYANGFSSSCHDDQHSNYRHSPQPSLMQNGGSGVKSGGGGGGGGSSTSRNISLHQQSPQHLHMGDRGTHDQTHDLRDEVGGPSRSGMTVQDLKHMTAMRMGHPSIGSRGGGGGGAGRGGSGGSGSVGGSVGGAIGEGKRSVLSSTSGSPPPDLLPSSSRHRTGLLHLSSTGRDTSPRPTATTQHILRASASARESRQERQQQHDLPPPPGVVLSRHSSAHAAVGGSPRYSHHHQQPNGSRGQLTARGSDMVSGHQIPQRGIHRGMSAPRLYPAAQDDQMPSGAHGGGASGGPRPFGPGLSVEELKEMTKLRLQQQGRSSPTFAGRAPSSGGLGSSLGSNGGVVHERTEWRRSGSAGSAAMMEEHGTAGAAPAPFRRANSLAARGMMQGEHSSAAMNGRRMFGSSGRMEIALPLEDRMRTLTSDGGTGGVSPRILSQPSSPCYSATSHSSSACTSPGGGRVHREGRGGGGGGGVGRYGGGGGGSAYAHSAHVPPPGFGDSGAPAAADGVYPTVTLPLSGDGGEKGFWSRHDSGNALHGFPNGDGSLHDVRGGRHHNRSGSGSTGASPRMESIDVNGAQPLGRRSSHMHHSFEDDGSVGGRGRNGLAGAGSFQAPAAARSLPMQTISRPMSLSLSPPGMVGSHINDNLSDPGNSNGSVSGGRKSSNPHWLDLQDAHVGGGSSSGLDLGGHRGTHFARSISRPTDLRLNNVNFEYPARPQSAGSVIGEGSSKIMSSVAAASWVRAGAPASSSAPSSTEDATAMMCAEFALLTPKSALQQHNQQQQHRVVGSPMPTWPPSWDATHDACDTIAESARRSEIADSGGVPSALRGRDAFNGSVGSVRGVASQGSRGGSEVGSPEGPQASKGGEEVDEQSTGSGGGSQQGSVHAAFGALDAAAGHGSGGGGEANVGGGGFDGSFADNADGDAGRNGGAEAQRYEGPLMHPTSFFGEDLPDCEGMGLEDESPASDDRSGSASGADSVGSPGSGAGAGKVASAGPADGTALAVAMDNQLSF